MMYLYHILSFLLLPFYVLLLIFRIISGKEDIKRIGERFAIGHSSNKQNEVLIWIHVASVGESFIAITLIENINESWQKTIISEAPLKFLVTSGTISSAKILQQKLPKNSIHQFIPIDNIIFVRKFFKNWQPNLGIFIESELWPCLVNEGKKHCKLLLLNARISDKSFALWKKINYFFKLITDNFSQIIVQSETDFQKFAELKVTNIVNLGNIKFANKKLLVNENELSILSHHMTGKKIIVLASTHLEDELVLFDIIKPLKQQYPNCYFILIPRHPERKNDIIKVCSQLDLSYSIKSEQKLPILDDDLYIIDKFGELGLFFSLAYISFIGGSFKNGGHNILEPAHFSNYIIFGPDISNYANIASELLENKAAIQIHNKNDLLDKMSYLLSESGIKEAKIYQYNALVFINKNQQILNDYLAVIENNLLNS